MKNATCTRCGLSWPSQRDEEIICGDCGGQQAFVAPTVTGNYDMASQITRYRLAMEMASSLVYRGKYTDAYDVLQEAMKPVRKSEQVMRSRQRHRALSTT